MTDSIESLLHGGQALFDHWTDHGGCVVGQEVGSPHHTAPGALREYLNGAVVVDQGTALRAPHEATRLVVDGHDRLLDYHAVAESDRAGAPLWLEPRIHDESRN